MEHPRLPIQSVHSSFFVLNVWEEELREGQTEWRGEIMNVENGAVHSFDDWPEVVDLIAEALHKLRPEGARISLIRQAGHGHNSVGEVQDNGRICE